jgi:hypothetical protein
VCFVLLNSSQDHLRTGTRNHGHPISCRCKKHQQLRARKGDLQRSFPLDVPMVPSSSIAMTADGVSLICGGFSLGGGSYAIAMGSTRGGPLPLRRTMTMDSTEEFPMALVAEGRTHLPSPRRQGAGATPASTTTIPPW